MKKTWKLFESVAYEYVSQLYKKTIKKEHTVDSHDSGYDGIWIIPSDDKALYRKILMEAKYRESQSSLPLSDCAKAIIIAFNSSANKLYIATNIELAPQTKKEIKNFNKRTALAIVSVDNIKLKNYIHNNKSYLVKACKTSEARLSNLENKIISLPTLETHQLNNVLTRTTCLLDAQREELISNIVKEVCISNSKFILSGTEGIGKSVLIDKICDELQKKKFDTQKIDLSLCTSSRILYLKVLEAVWGVSLDAVLEDTDLNTYIDKLIAIKDCVDSDISNAVKHILVMDIYEYEGSNDIYRHYLLKYLNAMLQDKSDFIHLAVIFENVDSLSIECIDFLLELIEQMKKNGIRILLELREPFLLMDDIKRSNDYYKIIKKNALVYSVEPLSDDVIYKLIRKYIKMDTDSCKQFSDILENNPLKIKNALEYLKQTSVKVNVRKLNKMSYEEREIFWNEQGIDPNRETVSLISRYRTNSFISEFLEMALLLNGEIPYPLLKDYWETLTDEISEFAINSRLFKLKSDSLQCVHLRFLSAIKTTSQPLERMKAAQKLLPIVQNKSDAKYPFIQLELIYILEQDNNIGDYTVHVMSLYEDSQQYQQSIATGKRYLERINNKMILSNSEKSMKVHILLKMLHCIYELNTYNEKEYEVLYQMTKESIILYFPTHTPCREWYEYSLYMWHKKFMTGMFDDAYQISKELYDNLPNICCLFDLNDDIAGRIYSAHGLSLKMIKGGAAASRLFKEGIKNYPESYNARAAYLSQEGNCLLKEKPLEAIKKYSELLDTVKGKAYPFMEIIHTRIDIAMSNFLAQEYETAKIWAEEGLNIASSLGIYAEKGRALNILGCCKAANGEFKDGLDILKEGDFYLDLSGDAIYRWRTMLNQASILLQIGDNKNAKTLITQVSDILLSDFTKKIKSDNKSVPYQSLLLILMYLHELEEDAESILLQLEDISIRDDFNHLCQTISWKNCFQNKVKYCNGIVLVTG
jgi:hypothetical protein